MANYIVDASVVMEYLITGPYTPNVQTFFNQITSADRLTVPECRYDSAKLSLQLVLSVYRLAAEFAEFESEN